MYVIFFILHIFIIILNMQYNVLYSKFVLFIYSCYINNMNSSFISNFIIANIWTNHPKHKDIKLQNILSQSENLKNYHMTSHGYVSNFWIVWEYYDFRSQVHIECRVYSSTNRTRVSNK